jgi:hypothetical protein
MRRRQHAADISRLGIFPCDLFLGANDRGLPVLDLGHEARKRTPYCPHKVLSIVAVGLNSHRSRRDKLARLIPVRWARVSNVHPRSARQAARRLAIRCSIEFGLPPAISMCSGARAFISNMKDYLTMEIGVNLVSIGLVRLNHLGDRKLPQSLLSAGSQTGRLRLESLSRTGAEELGGQR